MTNEKANLAEAPVAVLKPKDVTIDFKVFTTMQYDKVVYLEYNRPINPAHVRELVEEITAWGSFWDVLKFIRIPKSNKWYVLDGQHRVEALKILGAPIPHVFIEVLGGPAQIAKLIGSMNSSQKPWRAQDYMRCFAKIQAEPYMLFQRLFDEKKITISTLIELFCGGGPKAKRTFNSGQMVCKDESALLERYEEIIRLVDLLGSELSDTHKNVIAKVYLRYRRVPGRVFNIEKFFNNLKESKHTWIIRASEIEYQITQLMGG